MFHLRASKLGSLCNVFASLKDCSITGKAYGIQNIFLAIIGFEASMLSIPVTFHNFLSLLFSQLTTHTISYAILGLPVRILIRSYLFTLPFDTKLNVIDVYGL